MITAERLAYLWQNSERAHGIVRRFVGRHIAAIQAKRPDQCRAYDLVIRAESAWEMANTRYWRAYRAFYSEEN